MDAHEFLTMVKGEAVDYPPRSILKRLQTTQGDEPEARWFRALDENGQRIIQSLLQECAELSVFGFLTLLDGVGGPYPGVFQIIALDGEENRTLLNPEDGEMLHDTFSKLVAESRPDSENAL